MSTLIVFGGLPACGKSTLARALAERLAAVHVRVDTIEHELRAQRPSREDVGDAGYRIAYAVAADNLRLGHIVVADSVNPLPVTRGAWRRVATEADARMIAVEVVCSDASEHRRRVETRHIDITGFVGPSWEEVVARDYRPWPEADIAVDTAGRSVEACLAELMDFLAKRDVKRL